MEKNTTIYVYTLDYQLLYTFSSAIQTGLFFKSHYQTILKYA